jgi:uncharacterized alpha-E superfamily protein
MLCRTASDLYWLSRHVERMDNTARLLDLAHRTSLLPERLGTRRIGGGAWERALEALDLADAYAARHGEIDAGRVLNFLVFDPDNPASMAAAVHAARESARAQRGAITGEMYQSINSTWLQLRAMDWEQIATDGPTTFLDWAKRRSAAFRGVTLGTMGRDEGYEFLRLGTFAERADFGVRLLDANFDRPGDLAASEDGAAAEYYRMSAMLQALSAFETFRKIYRDRLTPARVAELVILRADMPRSLASCSGAMLQVIERLRGGAGGEIVRLAGQLASETRYSRIDEILAGGLHGWLTRWLERLYRLADETNREFFFATDVIAA